MLSAFSLWGGREAATPPRVILLIGDSLTSGYGVRAEDALPAQVERLLRREKAEVSVRNGGVAGDTTASARARLVALLNQVQPDAVVIGLGANDVLRLMPPHETRRNLRYMLDVITQRHIPVMLAEVDLRMVSRLVDVRGFTEIYDDLADDYAIPTTPFYLEDVLGNPRLMQPDGIHPNAAGVAIAAQRLADDIKDHWLD